MKNSSRSGKTRARATNLTQVIRSRISGTAGTKAASLGETAPKGGGIRGR